MQTDLPRRSQRRNNKNGVAADRSRAPLLLLTMVMLLMAVGLFYGGIARTVSPTPGAPGPGSSIGTTLFRLATGIAAIGAIATALRGSKISRTYVVSAVTLSSLIAIFAKLGWAGATLQDQAGVINATIALVAVPLLMSAISERQAFTALIPIVACVVFSTVSKLAGGEYYFAWYNQWGLYSSIVLAAGLRFTTLSRAPRVLLLVAGASGIALSTSRQALLAAAICTIYALVRSRNTTQRVRALGIGLAALFAGYELIGGSDRVAELGSVTDSNGRGSLWASSWEWIGHSPIYGLAGLGQTGTEHEALLRVGLGWSTSVHVFPLDAWLRAGVLGLAAALAFVYALLRGSQRNHKYKTLLGLVALPFLLLGSELLYFDDLSAGLCIGVIFGIGSVAVNVNTHTSKVVR